MGTGVWRSSEQVIGGDVWQSLEQAVMELGSAELQDSKLQCVLEFCSHRKGGVERLQSRGMSAD